MNTQSNPELSLQGLVREMKRRLDIDDTVSNDDRLFYADVLQRMVEYLSADEPGAG